MRPFKKMERTSDYVFSLPESNNAEDSYPWDDRKWQGEWLWNRGGIGPAEAYFWFVAMTHPERIHDTRTQFKAPRDLRRIRHVDADRFTLEDARERMSTWFDLLQQRPAPMRWFPHAYLTRFLRELLPMHEVLELLFEIIPADQVRHFFAHLMVPREDEAREAVYEVVRARLGQLDYSTRDELYTGIRLLERIPLDEQAVRLVGAVSAQDDPDPMLVRDAVNLLQDPATFAEWFAELDAYNMAAEEVPYIFGKGRYEVIEPLFDRVKGSDASFQMTAVKDLVRIHSWRAVKGFVSLYDDSAVGPMAHGWLTAEGANAVKGLIPLATGRSRLTHVAQRLLREYRDRGHGDLIQRLALKESESVRARVVDEILEQGIGLRTELPESEWPDWMAGRLVKKKPTKRLPDYIDVELLPPLVTRDGEHVLPQSIVFGVLNRIVSSRPDKIDELIPKLREFLDPSSRHAFAWYLFERWREHGSEARKKFCMWSLGFLGTDESAARLTPYLNEWTSGGHFHRAKWALDVYRVLGTDAALTTLHRVSQRARSRALREHAQEVLGEIAKERGLSVDELEDRIIPDCGLDDDGESASSTSARARSGSLSATSSSR